MQKFVFATFEQSSKSRRQSQIPILCMPFSFLLVWKVMGTLIGISLKRPLVSKHIVEISGTMTHVSQRKRCCCVCGINVPLRCEVLLKGPDCNSANEKIRLFLFSMPPPFDPSQQVLMIKPRTTSLSLLLLKTRRALALGPCRSAPDEEVGQLFLHGCQKFPTPFLK